MMANQMQPPSTPRSGAVTLGGSISQQSPGTYRPKAHRTKGARLACLVNASVTVCPDNTIYAFGGFDQFTDEVYNHVLRLDLQTFTWTLVDNFGDIPSVRMGHTSTYWKDNKLIVFGGENEHRSYLSDVYIFDITSATWEQPLIDGPPPRGRSRHAVVLYDEKLFVTGGTCGSEVLQDVTYLDLRTMTWSRTWNFVGRFDHTTWVRDGRLYVFGGLTQDMDRTCELEWLDLRESPAWKTFETFPASANPRSSLGQRSYSSPPSLHGSALSQQLAGGTAAKPAGATVSQYKQAGRNHVVNPPNAPGSINSLRFLKGGSIPSEAIGNHFHRVCGPMLLDFVTPANTIRDHETSLVALDLESFCWRTLADGEDVFVSASYRWHYLAVSPDQATAYLLGCPSEGGESEYLSDILPIDLRRYGVIADPAEGELGGAGNLGMDLAGMFNDPATADFVVTAMSDSAAYGDEDEGIWAVVPHPADNNAGGNAANSAAAVANSSNQVPANAISPPMHVHKLILLARWQHFSRLYNARMAEFHSGKLYIPEPYSVVKAFLYYLYSDSIRQSEHCHSLTTVAGLLVLSNIYNIPRLRALSLARLNKELDVESAAAVWERAVVAGEEGLRIKAARFCMLYWGRIVRTEGFRRLSRKSMMELCEEIDVEGRVLGVDELELVGGLAGGRISHSRTTGRQSNNGYRAEGEQQGGGLYWEEEEQEDGAEDDEDDGDEGMEIN